MLSQRREFYAQMAELIEEIETESRRALQDVDERYDHILRRLHEEFGVPYAGYSSVVGRETSIPQTSNREQPVQNAPVEITESVKIESAKIESEPRQGSEVVEKKVFNATIPRKRRGRPSELEQLIREIISDEPKDHVAICCALKEKGYQPNFSNLSERDQRRRFSNNVGNKLKHLLNKGKIVSEGEKPHCVYQWVSTVEV